MSKWHEIFAAGKHTDTNGVEMSFAEADLDKVVASYDPAKHEAPIVIGHPKADAPAYGWVSALKRSGNKLLAQFKQVAPEFSEMVNRGSFKKKSASFYLPDLTLRHVGFLGAMPPVVKGLADVSFSESDKASTFECSEADGGAVRRLFSGLRDFLIEKFTLDVADRVIPSWSLDGIEVPEPMDVPGSVSTSYSEGGDMPTPREKELEDQLAAANAKAQTAEADKARLTVQFSESETKRAAAETEAAAAKTKLAEQETAKRTAENLEFCESLVKAGKLKPAHKDKVLGVLGSLHGATVIEFSEGDKKESKSPAQALMEVLNDLPKFLEFAEVATGDKAATASGNGTAGEKLKAAAEKKMSENKNLSYSEALIQAQKESPELAKEFESEIRG